MDPKPDNLPAQPGKAPAFSEETIKNLVALQTKEIEVRQLELSQRNKELDNNAAHAGKILEAQRLDRENARLHARGSRRDTLYTVIAIVVVVLIFAGYGLRVGQGALVKDILQIVISAALGALGGYGVGKQKSKSEKNDSED